MSKRVALFPEVLAASAAEDPDRVFLRHVNGDAVSYGGVFNAWRRWASAYAHHGVQPGDAVVTMMRMRFEFYYSWLGLAWLKAIETPLNTDYRGAMLTHALRSSRPRLVVVEARLLDQFEAIADDLDERPVLVVLDGTGDAAPSYRTVPVDEFLRSAAPLTDVGTPSVWDTATVVYTSGTTGPSKGVRLPWGQLHRLAMDGFPFEDLREDDCFYLPLVTYHIGAKAMPYLMAMCKGSVVIRERFSATEFLDDIATHRCTVTVMVAGIAQLMLAVPPKPDDAQTPLRYTLMAPVIANVEEFSRRFGVKVCAAYGMTELPPVIGSNGWDVTDANHASCGRLKPGYQARIVDEHDFEVPPGEIGELIVRSDEPWALNDGYVGMPEATARAWRTGWFHTGDAFRRDEEGNYYFVDRIKDAIRRRGENISSFEVESIVTTHPEVLHAAAVAVPSEIQEDEVKIVVVRKPESALTERELIEYLIPIMPRFMVPRYVEFVGELPKTPTDRVQKVLLREAGVTERTWDRERVGIRVPA